MNLDSFQKLEKASLIFRLNEKGKERLITLREQENQRISAKQNSLLDRIGAGGLAADALDRLVDEVNDLEDELSNTANKLYGIGEEEKILSFQFNPSTLRITAYGGGMTPIYNFVRDPDKQKNVAEKKSNIRYGPVQTNITVDFKVIFDAERNTDAFMADKLNILSSPVKTGMDLVAKDVFSVRQIVEGFLVIIRNHDSRIVTFKWGNLSYSGTLNAVQCNYTMFNTSGEPIRAEVSIRLLANKDAGTTEGWKKKYKTYFNEAVKGTSNVSNIANNLINLQL